MPNFSAFIDRKIGGLGDLMMLSRSLKKMLDSDGKVTLCLDEEWHDLFQRAPFEVVTQKRESNPKWTYKIHSPCPAGRVESELVARNLIPETHRTNVYMDRVSIFALAMGVWLEPEERTPYIWLNDEDYANAHKAIPEGDGPLIYLQLTSAEIYRDWKNMKHLIPLLHQMYPDARLMCYGKESIDGVTTFQSDLLTSLAIIGSSTLVVSPDSMSVHAAAALEIPCVSIYGPIGAETRIGNYPYCSAVCTDLPCMPCWRHGGRLCEYKSTDTSYCLETLSQMHVALDIKERMSEIAKGQMRPNVKYRYV